jgi:hypothetical protein
MISSLSIAMAASFPSLEKPKSTIDIEIPVTTSQAIYNVGTIVTGIDAAKQLTIDSNNNIYYIDFYNNERNKLMCITDGIIDVVADGGTEKARVLDLINIVYDPKEDRVLLLCNVNSGYYAYNSEFIGTSAIYDVADLSAPIATFQEGYFTSFSNPIMLNNVIINNGLRFDINASTTTIFTGGYYSIYNRIIDKQYITFDGIFRKFNLSLNKEIEISVDFDNIKTVDSISSYNDKFYLYSKDDCSFYEIDTRNDNPKAELFIAGDELIINDFLPFSSVEEFTFINDGEIIFYDNINKAIRTISVQETNGGI